MALIICTECGKKFSDKAPACPECGCPTEEILKAIDNGVCAPVVESIEDNVAAVAQQNKPAMSSEEASNKMKEACSAAMDAAKKASDDFDFASELIQSKAEITMDLRGSGTLSRVADIAADSKKACDELYAALQVQVIAVDTACRPLIDSNPGVDAVCDVACTIEYLNEESRISNNFTGSLNNSASTGLASTRYSPSLASVAVEKYWQSLLNSLPGGKEAADLWHQKRNEEERKAREAARKAVREAKERERKEAQEEKKRLKLQKENEANKRAAAYAECREEILKQRKKADSVSAMFSVGLYGAVYIRMDGTVKGKWNFIMGVDQKTGNNEAYFANTHNAIGCATNCECVTVLRSDGTCVTNGTQPHYMAMSGWRNIKKIVAADHFMVGLREDGTVVSTYEKGWNVGHGDAGKCKTEDLHDIVEIACGEETCYALTKDGNLLAADSKGVTTVYNGGDLETISACYFDREDQLAGLKRDGTIYTKGITPQGIGDDGRIVQLIVVGGVVYALLLDGTVKGHRVVNRYGQDEIIGECKETDVIALGNGLRCLGFVLNNGRFYSLEKGKYNNRYNAVTAGNLWEGTYEEVIAAKEAEERRKEAEKKQMEEWRNAGLCPYCGGQVKKSLFGGKCLSCGKKI